jgi:proteasome lid subunit RPN8/RPN11
MLRITPKVAADLVAHALRDAPVEACGYLAERDGIVIEAIPLKNSDASPEHFALDPAEQFASLRRMRAEGLTLKGAYHSHPVTPARPSSEDIRLSQDPDLSYVIVSLAADEPDIKSFHIRGGSAADEDIIIEK